MNADRVIEAARLIRAGGLVAFPTETVYGLGANALDGRAVARIFAAKGRPRFNPLIVHVENSAKTSDYGELSAEAEKLALAFWPGALTLVVPVRQASGLSDLVTAGLPTVALRVPSHPLAQALLAAAGVPIAAPSANISGRVSATRAEHVSGDFANEINMILDGGPATAGLESTIVALAGDAPVLLRAGAVPAENIETVLGLKLRRAGVGIQAPGMMQSHYAPRAQLRLNAETPRVGEAFLGFGPGPDAADAGPVLNLSPSGDLIEAAANLFAHLRALDASGAGLIAVAPIPQHGLGEAINDRLRRAAAPRPE